MKIFRGILVTILIFVITFLVPFTIENKIYFKDYTTTAEGQNVSGPFGYISKIFENEDATVQIKNDTAYLSQEWQNILRGVKKDFYFLAFILEILLSISVLSIGFIILRTTKDKLTSIPFIIASLLSVACYIGYYYICCIFFVQ